MWICTRCQTQNKDGYSQCVQCSAPRNARRFGAATPVSAPSVQAAPNERRMQPPEPQETAPSPRRKQHQAELPQPRAGRAPGGLVRLVGRVLAIALPALVLLLAVLRLEELKPLVVELFWGKPPQTLLVEEPNLLKTILEWLAYGLGALLAALLAAAPGLSVWALGHLCRGVRRA